MRLTQSLWPVLALAGLLAACSNKEVEPDPSPLPKLQSTAVHFDEQWSRSVGAGLSGQFLRLRPAVTEAAVFAVSHDGVVLAVDKASGKVLWKQETKTPFTGGVSAGYGLLFAGTGKGELVAMATDSGAVRWRAALSATVLSAAAVSADVVVVECADGKVYGLKRETGERIWTHDTLMPTLSLRGNATPMIQHDLVYIGTANGKVEAVGLADGAPQWDLRVATNQGRSELERMLDVDGDMVTDGDNTAFAVGFQSQLTGVDLSEGHRLWQYDLSSVQNLATGLGNVYAVDTKGSVFAIDQQSGKAVWKQPALGYRHLVSPVTVGNLLLVGDYQGYVHVLQQVDGHVVGRFRLGHWGGRSEVASLVVDQGTVYAYSAGGQLSAWHLRGQ